MGSLPMPPAKVVRGGVLLNNFCNVYGTETGGANHTLGGLGPKPDRQWYCPFVAMGRFIMTCEHRHRGPEFKLCSKHLAQYRDKVYYCPACNIEPPGHRCQLLITEKS